MVNVTMKESAGEALDRILRNLSECNAIKYVAYRTASKIFTLQNAFFLDKLPVDVLAGVLQQHHLTCTENAVRLTPSELCNLLEDVYFVVSREHTACLDTDHAVNVLCRFLLHVLKKDAGVELLGVKVILTALCGSKPKDKYNYLFSQLSDHNSVLTSRRLELLLQRLVLLTDFIGEGKSFGRALIPGTVQSCFQDLTVGNLGVSLEGFHSWLTRDPQLLVWLSTLHRLHLANTVVHDVKCSVCKTTSIRGLRYRCLRCLSFNQCQNCFFTGRVSRSHKKNHPVQEYCYQTTAKQSLRALLSTFRNKLLRSGWKLQYLPAENRESYLEETTLQLEKLDESTRTLTQTSAISLNELENIIAVLEEQSQRLLKCVDVIQAPDVKTVLNSHKILVEKQVERLKNLKSQFGNQKKACKIINSTPCARLARRGGAAVNISPITSNSMALTWDKYDIEETEEVGPCVLTWEERSGSSSSEPEVQPVSSHAYTWLQNTNTQVHLTDADAGLTKPAENKQPEDIKALHDDLDQILNRLQELLSNTNTDEGNRVSSVDNANNEIWDRL